MTHAFEILTTLHMWDGFLVAEPQLLNQLRLVATPLPTATSLRSDLAELESRRLVLSVQDSLDPKLTKWKLTDAGKAEVLSRL